ncbi:MAG: NUDIX hydrolase [Mycobacteriales bacterium]
MLLAVCLLAVLLLAVVWIAVTVNRLDRLDCRVRAARAALDVALMRRAAAVMELLASGDTSLDDALRVRLQLSCQAAMTADPAAREAAENDLGNAVATLLASQRPTSAVGAVDEPGGARAAPLLGDTSTRIVLARRFYNDAVRDSRSLRGRRLTRVLHLASGDPAPEFFEIAEPVAPRPSGAPRETAAIGLDTSVLDG